MGELTKRLLLSLIWMLPIASMLVASIYIWWVTGDGRFGLVMLGFFAIVVIPIALTVDWVRGR